MISDAQVMAVMSRKPVPAWVVRDRVTLRFGTDPDAKPDGTLREVMMCLRRLHARGMVDHFDGPTFDGVWRSSKTARRQRAA